METGREALAKRESMDPISQNAPTTDVAMDLSLCPAREDLARYVDAHVDSRRAAWIAAHLETCAACESVVSELESGQRAAFLPLAREVAGSDASTEPARGVAAGDLPTLSYTRSAAGAEALRRIEAGQEIGDCRLLTELGEGSFARVFLAEQKALRRWVALKVSTRASREPALLATLDHPHIVRVYHYDQHPATDAGLHLLYMQYVPGCTLRRLIERIHEFDPAQRSGRLLLTLIAEELQARGDFGPRPAVAESPLAELDWPSAVCWIGARLAHALHYAHTRGVHHRDVKPANILLAADGSPMLVDFNVSFGASLDGATPAECFGGSLPYMSPEQLEAFETRDGIEQVAGASDVYSLAVVLWELLTGARPFGDQAFEDAATTTQIAANLRAADRAALRAALPADGPRDLERFFDACLTPMWLARPTADVVAHRLDMYSLPERCRVLFPPIPRWWMRCLAVALYITALSLPNALLTVLSILHHVQFTVINPAWDEPFLLRVETPVVIALCNLVGVATIVAFAWPPLKLVVRRRPAVEFQSPQGRAWEGTRCLEIGAFAGAMMLALWLAAAIALPLWNRLGSEHSRIGWGEWIDFFVPHLLFGLVSAPVLFISLTLVILHELYPPLIPFVGGPETRRALPRLQRWLRRSTTLLAITPYLGLLALAVSAGVDNRFCITVAVVGLSGYLFALLAAPHIQSRLAMIDRALTPLDEQLAPPAGR